MRKVKLLPSVLMLILCIGVLAFGIYAAAPVSHSIVGTINVSAAGANVRITAYLDKTGDGYSNDDEIISNDGNGNNYLETRTNGTLNINANSLDFTETDMGNKKVYLKIENLSSIDLGAYFPVGEIGTTGAAASNIASVKFLDGTSESGTVTDIVKCSFGAYTEVQSLKTSYLNMELSLAKLSHFEDVTVALNLTLNLENYNANLAEVAGVNVYTNNQNVAISSAVSHGQTLSTQTYTETKAASYRYTSTGTTKVALDANVYSDNFGTVKGNVRNETTKVTFKVTNNGENPISVDISTTSTFSNIEIITLNNPYIAPKGGEGEVSIQYALVSGKTSTADISTANCKIDVYEATEDTKAQADIQDRIQVADESDMVGNMKYYIEYGVNPYNNNEALRWFIWGKDNGSGTAVALGTTDPRTTTGTYYFISEHILDPMKNNMGLSFQNTFDSSWSYNIYGNNPSDYAGSNYRNYVNGLTVKRSYDDSNSDYIAAGDNINFYDNFGLTNDALYSMISARTVSDLYTNDSGYASTMPSTYSPAADKFWALSYSEVDVIGWGDNAVAKTLTKDGTSGSADYWWLRSPGDIFSE